MGGLAHPRDGEGPSAAAPERHDVLRGVGARRQAARRAPSRRPMRLPGAVSCRRRPLARMEGHAEDVVRLLDALSIPCVDVVAASFGGTSGSPLQRSIPGASPGPGRHGHRRGRREHGRGERGAGRRRQGGPRGRRSDEGLRPNRRGHLLARMAGIPQGRAAASGARRWPLPQAWFAGPTVLQALVAVDLKPYLSKIVACSTSWRSTIPRCRSSAPKRWPARFPARTSWSYLALGTP